MNISIIRVGQHDAEISVRATAAHLTNSLKSAPVPSCLNLMCRLSQYLVCHPP